MMATKISINRASQGHLRWLRKKLVEVDSEQVKPAICDGYEKFARIGSHTDSSYRPSMMATKMYAHSSQPRSAIMRWLRDENPLSDGRIFHV